ncbi:MAG: TetR family transcriptional regulator [Alteromonadaceae bacterium]|mgnify:CR=1 FL=1|uniref:TetR/AcrR family transcriptional regulator n=1 Tax=unclassified Marinobacter TaxID=83889 RepID=UPI000C5B3C14|nr:TetR/AcrR family transcriptional regulator [Marinobacter sp. BGYM27]MAA66769.1 TetR family transcriptional regulator [Alteromonadaceae bacterium]MBH85426.1 TetR family transcriptional regulator [Alteromonadaceae bacterium]MDG5499963.1 TetR/AcrR family transcriptional regulator [Marinobacter sp. BGYM27]|tara:strand:- start:33063 stop:33749 length:687 start_codon:yes stop_codon:yes gene_type:complete
MTLQPESETATERQEADSRGRRYRPGRIRERNRECIIVAAEQEFAQHGFRGTTIQNIAERAELPKSNVLYYFSSKKRIYHALFDDILTRWNAVFSEISPEDDPAECLASFIRTKVELSRSHPLVSRLFAMEIIQGAPFLKDHLRTNMREWVRGRAGVIQQWIDEGRMANVDPVQLIFLIWSSTQHYADFQVQILMVENKAEYEQRDFDHAADFLISVILRGCGLEPPK